VQEPVRPVADGESAARIPAFFVALPFVSSAFAISVGSLVLIGWFLDNELLKRVVPSFVAMNPMSAILFVFSGAAFVLALRAGRSVPINLLAKGLSVLVGVIALLKTAGYFITTMPEVDQILFTSKLVSIHDHLPNRMAPNTTLNFIFISLSLFMLGKTGKRFCASQAFAILAAFGALLPLTGYAYGVHDFSGLASFIPMAVHSAITSLVLASGLFFASTTAPLTRVFLANDSTGVLARRLFPLAVFVTLFLGWLRVWGEDHEIYESRFGTALFAIVLSVLFVILVRCTVRTVGKLETERATAYARLHDLNRRKDEMIAVVSHDLCSPLTGCRMVIDLLRDKVPENGIDLLETMDHSVRRMVSMVRGLLDISKLEAEQIELERELVRVSDVIHQSIEPLAINADAKQIVLRLEVDPSEPVLNADRLRLSQIFNNLLSNAVKFTPAGGSVTATVERNSDGVRVTITDTGLGVPRPDLPHIFDRYYQASTKATAGERGMGLGLAIVREMIVLHDGHIEVTSEVNRGTTFIVHLPRGPQSRAYQAGAAMLKTNRKHAVRIQEREIKKPVARAT
jgi:signal transduction histidine kinase